MDNQNNNEIIYETTNIQEEIEKRIKLAREVISGDKSTAASIIFSPHAAINTLKAAIEMGSSEAKALLAGYYYKATGEDRNYEEAFRLATESAEDGDAEGLTVLGRILLEGRAAERDNDRAFRLLSEAAEKGNAEAQFLLGHPIHLSPILEQNATKDQKRRKIDLVDYYFESNCFSNENQLDCK